MLESKILTQIKKKIAKQFPEFAGIEPRVIKKKVAPQKVVFKKLSLGVPKDAKTIFSLRFERKIKTIDAVVMKQILVVTTNELGQIIKISQSK
ncbi:MAG: hypothetical protein ACUVQ4_07295 [bacterium]